MSVRERLYTVEEFWEIARLPENEERRLELEDGVIIDVGSSTKKNTITGMRVGSFLNNFVIPRNLGYVTGADGGFVVGNRVRRPDTAFIAAVHAQSLNGVEFDVAPDLAVEVASPDEDVLKKAREYILAGTQLVWVVYVEERIVYVFRPPLSKTSQYNILDENDTLDGGDVLPGFTLSVRDIFPPQNMLSSM
jgi:Uma2 family endonuclease